MEQRVATILTRLASEDSLGMQEFSGDVWQAKRLQKRRYSWIYALRPARHAHRLLSRVGSEELILKVYRARLPERRQQEFDDVCRVYEAMSIHSSGGVLRPIACFPELGALITARAPGTSGGELIRATCRHSGSQSRLENALTLCSGAGHWLRLFQARAKSNFDLRAPAELGSPQRMLAYLRERLVLARRTGLGISKRESHSLIHVVECLLAERESSLEHEITWSHSDYGPHNMLLQNWMNTKGMPEQLKCGVGRSNTT